MAILVSVDMLRAQLNLAPGTGDEALLTQKLEAAEESVVRYTHRTREELTAIGGGQFPAPLIEAILVRAAAAYSYRESVTSIQAHPVPDSYYALVKPYRKLADDEEEEDEP